MKTLNTTTKRMLEILIASDEFTVEVLADHFSISKDTVWRTKRTMKNNARSIIKEYRVINNIIEF